MPDLTADRTEIVDYLRRELIGPSGGETELLADPPHRRYIMGTLYPRRSAAAEIEEEDQEDVGAGGVGEELADDPVVLAHDWMPSSVGMSFYLVDGNKLNVGVWGARYEVEKNGRSRRWRRRPLASRERPEAIDISVPDTGSRTKSIMVLNGRCTLESRWRPLPNGYLVTVTLVNAATDDGDEHVDTEATVHQVGFSCSPTGGRIVEYPQVDSLSTDPEDEELRVAYRAAKTFAVGHGCAVAWSSTESWSSRVSTEFLPGVVVPGLVASTDTEKRVLRLAYLAHGDLDQESLAAELEDLLAPFAAWIDGLRDANTDIPDSSTAAVNRILARLGEVLERIRAGINVLRANQVAFRSFRLANEAMLMQMRHAENDLGGRRHRRDVVDLTNVDYAAFDAYWYPFQLAYQLLVIPSLTGAAPDDRELVDLLWFPTGGGKTEAYLAVAAFEIIRRRLADGERGAGTAVLTRYTLRLLTTQQFQRAAAMICALEQIREPNELGAEPFRVGLWVGREASPNTFEQAEALLEDLLEEEHPTGRFQLDRCPWCGTELFPESREENVETYGYRASGAGFRFHCPTKSCRFHSELPVSVVDQDLYRTPPTMLVATVDKFARLAWVEAAGAFFGGETSDPPSLIIQDELHLLSGPLGTTVGVYEAAVETLIEAKGKSPKVVASTATIRRAGEQSLGLFARDVCVFPAPGLNADDSFFARVDKEAPGRLYLGVMAPSHTNSFAMVHLAAALLQAQAELPLQAESRDGYGTLVAYHNSLRELGRTVTLARDDVPARINAIAADEKVAREIDDHRVVELTSNIAGRELPGILQRMELPIDDGDAIDLLASTNMLSVGVDVPRLALMLVNGQPKTTSEYIQASSRVGRSRVPGLVATLFAATKPRDRSHYERFGPYHSALYRFVEPTSVTPFSPPSRSRSLHAALVILVRHGAGLSAENEAGYFDPDDPKIARAVGRLIDRVSVVDEAEARATKQQLDRLVEHWASLAARARAEGLDLFYDFQGKQHLNLLKNFGERGEGWETLHSMRNVDGESSLYIMGSK